MRATLAAIAVALLISVTACGGDDTTDTTDTTSTTTSTTATTEDSTTTSSSTTTAAPTSTSERADDGSAAVDFFRSTEAICIEYSEQVGNTPPEPEQYTSAIALDEVEPGVWLIRDGHDQELLVDLGLEVVFSTDGPDGYLPFEYSFGCPTDVYPGSWD